MFRQKRINETRLDKETYKLRNSAIWKVKLG